MIRTLWNRATGTIASERFESPRWIWVIYSDSAQYSGMQSGVSAAGYKLTADRLRVRKATQRMNESPYRTWNLEDVKKAWIGSSTWQAEMLVEPDPEATA